jgi:membrane-bound metal-dependent hydrolase YbcI (DUF457 family)
MFVGHTAVALAAKVRVPEISLGWWVAAAFALDLVWPILLLAGIEHVSIVAGATAFNPLVFDSYPWSHSLLMSCVWGIGAAAIARFRGRSFRVALLFAIVVVSHWLLDFVSHVPDMPLWPGESPRLGLGLWQSVPATLLIEGLMFTGAVAWYASRTRAIDWIGRIAFWSFVLISAAMWASGPWSPPPPDARSLAWFALGSWLLVAWAGWADRHRRPVSLTLQIV